MFEELIVTLGPQSFNDKFLKNNVDNKLIFRINAAHVHINELADVINRVRESDPKRKIIVDIPGNKLRLTKLDKNVRLDADEVINLYGKNINFNIDFSQLEIGTSVLTNDGQTKLLIKSINKSEKRLELVATEKCLITKGKGIHFVGINPSTSSAILTKDDIKIINLCKDNKVNFVGVSFIRSAADIEYVEHKFDKYKLDFMYKIETQGALDNLESIFKRINWAILDRGDLASEIGLLNLFSAINKIIDLSQKEGINLFIATQILSSLKESNVPSISDVVDIQSLLEKGVKGFQFSDETAIGKDAQNCVNWFKKIKTTG